MTPPPGTTLLMVMRFLEICALGTWLGAMVFFSFGVAPAAFSVLPRRPLAGELVSRALERLYPFGYLCAALFLLGVWVEQRLTGVGLRPLLLPLVLIALLLLCSIYNHAFLGGRMTTLRRQMQNTFGSVDDTPSDHALRVRFNRYHQQSVLLLSGIMLGVLLLLGLTLRRFS